MKVFGFAGWSGSGKTTLIEQVIPEITRRGLKVSVIKHAHHGFDIDKPGKDSWRHREAGASEILLISDERWVLMHELRGEPEPDLDAQLARLSPCDLVLVEGFKAVQIPKLEVHRPAVGKPLQYQDNPAIVAIATDVPLDAPLPRLDINDPAAVAAFILQHQGLI
ncbi:molybdopterin-guanine dinucleotide biosynthesis protein MobB [Zoogloea oryzae]|uniref:Molybdopterin-guanine dinucleotide biosynthesis protein MobB n=1 Tax=Zoogloea oryzae TaxID=310767 RepID=A0ABQ6F737_9RHOO|nr:molybdopterin-guanine dinucleotide biosynthesis protein B [Zoogloea oryzae]GLT20741.1 molybdopterin-guanine dinucleotide biosynthesis protein MobB [Zoogloea oryzae]